jgi:hypothetical protein
VQVICLNPPIDTATPQFFAAFVFRGFEGE